MTGELHERTQIQAQAQADAMFANPPILPIRWNIMSGQSPDGQPVLMIAIETPAGMQKLVMGRDDALNLASQLRKTAQTGPQLVAPPPGLVVPRA